MGAPLDLTSRSPFRLRSARTLSTTLLGFEFLQRPQHVLSNFLDQPHSSVLARSTTIAPSSAFSLAFALAFSAVPALRLPIGNPLLLGLSLGVSGEVGLLVPLIYLALTVVMCMVVSLTLTDPAPVVLRPVHPERERWLLDPPWLFALLGSHPAPSGPILPMVPHVVRHKCEEMSLLVILPGPVVLATSNTILRGVGRVLLDLPMMAVFPVASLSMTMSILHVGLVLRIELQLHRDVLKRYPEPHGQVTAYNRSPVH